MNPSDSKIFFEELMSVWLFRPAAIEHKHLSCDCLLVAIFKTCSLSWDKQSVSFL